MEGFYLIRSLGLMIIAAAVLALIFRPAKVPALITYIVAGLLLGPIMEGIAELFFDGSEAPFLLAGDVDVIGEVGIVLLLFIVGLELSFERIRDVGKVALVAGLGQIVFTAIGGLGLTWLLGFHLVESVFIATALTFSSTVVVVKLLDEKKELHALYGRIAVGIFLVQDLVVIMALTFLAGLGSPELFEPAVVLSSLAKAFTGMGLLLALALLSSRYLLGLPFTWISRLPDAAFVWSLGWCFFFVVAAQLLDLSPAIGAFLAGISLAQLDSSHDLRRRVHPLMNFFVAVFFITLGARMELQAALQHWDAALVLSLFVLIGNPLIFIWIIGRSGYGERTSFLTSVTVAQISEFSFIFAALGLSSGLIRESVLSLITMVGLFTIAVSAYMILYNHQLYQVIRKAGLLKIFTTGSKEETEVQTPLSGHIIVVGLNAMGRKIVQGLRERGEKILVIDTDVHKLRMVSGSTRLGNVDYLSVIEEAFLPTARLAVSTLRIEDTNSLFAYRCNLLGVPVAIHTFDRSATETLKDVKIQYLIDSKKIGATEMLHEIRQMGVPVP
ncbi:MAG: cation:proton antiporter [Acidobacteriota bacterium]